VEQHKRQLFLKKDLSLRELKTKDVDKTILFELNFANAAI